ncbi:uncharacterized protein LOC141860528 isoform X2 [Acropora palmata]|uniref:uncharacterized protein LOC141860528 isoform X2 n=1 Tax=Acropora palmata TaxID=6131 RepID=UPI003DA125D1
MKEKNGLRNQFDALTKELKNLQARIDGKLTKETSRPSPPSSPVDQAEVSKSIEFLGLECDDLNNFSAAKSFKEQHQFSYCWTKYGTVYLRRSESSRALRIKRFSIADLSTLAQEDLEIRKIIKIRMMVLQ